MFIIAPLLPPQLCLLHYRATFTSLSVDHSTLLYLHRDFFRSQTTYDRGYLALNVVFDIERELERADALGAFLSMDEYSPDALVASLELLTKRARHVPQN